MVVGRFETIGWPGMGTPARTRRPLAVNQGFRRYLCPHIVRSASPGSALPPGRHRLQALARGALAGASELTINLSGPPRDDSEIARAIARILDWDVLIPAGKVKARVAGGWITLDGQVDYDFQRREVERMVRNVRGVQG